MEKLMSLENAIKLAKGHKKPHLLLGNGFSRACRNDIFAYEALFDRADFKDLSESAQAAFEALKTRDFEVVIRALRSAAALIAIYAPKDKALADMLQKDADGLREVLVHAVAHSHPERPADIPSASYGACRSFLNNFGRIYTLNYDLLLYWALMQDEIEPALDCDDGFRTPIGGKADYVTWEIENSGNQTVHYLHGALHLFDAGDEIKKFTWKNTGVALIEQIREALRANMYPIFVAEGKSREKVTRIKHSDYLSRSFRSFSAIGGPLFIYGHSLGESDEHILRLIERGKKISHLFISIFDDPASADNKRIMARAQAMSAQRADRYPLQVEFYDAASARVWG